jgi:hypothetical protein
MEPLNKRERTRVMTKFSLAFAAGILIVLIPFYFLIRLPEYEHDIMAKDYKDMQKQMIFQKETFAVQIDSVKRLIEKFDSPTHSISVLNADIGRLLSDMKHPFTGDTTWSGRMYLNIVKAFTDLQQAKNDQIQGKKDLKDCKDELDKAKEAAKKSLDTMGG